MKTSALTLLLASTVCCAACAQQRVDDSYEPTVANPLFAYNAGPWIGIDGGHENFHTLGGKFAPFGKVARRDGFKVRALESRINTDALQGLKILVIANA